MAAGFGGGFHAVGFHGGRFGRGGFRATAAFVATGFGLVGFLGGFLPRLLWRLLPRLLRIRLLLSDRIRDHALLRITAGCPGSIAVPRQSPEPRPIAGPDGGA